MHNRDGGRWFPRAVGAAFCLILSEWMISMSFDRLPGAGFLGLLVGLLVAFGFLRAAFIFHQKSERLSGHENSSGFSLGTFLVKAAATLAIGYFGLECVLHP